MEGKVVAAEEKTKRKKIQQFTGLDVPRTLNYIFLPLFFAS